MKKAGRGNCCGSGRKSRKMYSFEKSAKNFSLCCCCLQTERKNNSPRQFAQKELLFAFYAKGFLQNFKLFSARALSLFLQPLYHSHFGKHKKHFKKELDILSPYKTGLIQTATRIILFIFSANVSYFRDSRPFADWKGSITDKFSVFSSTSHLSLVLLNLTAFFTSFYH